MTTVAALLKSAIKQHTDISTVSTVNNKLPCCSLEDNSVGILLYCLLFLRVIVNNVFVETWKYGTISTKK